MKNKTEAQTPSAMEEDQRGICGDAGEHPFVAQALALLKAIQEGDRNLIQRFSRSRNALVRGMASEAADLVLKAHSKGIQRDCIGTGDIIEPDLSTLNAG